MTVRKTGRGHRRDRLTRSRMLGRHEARHDTRVDGLLAVEGAGRKKAWGRAVPPCFDCGCSKRDNRKWFKGSWGWAKLCSACWVKRGCPSEPECIAMVEANELTKKEESEARRQSEIQSGERPW